jgi:hypothetical protein
VLIERGAQPDDYGTDGEEAPRPRRYSSDLLPTHRRLTEIHRTARGTLSLMPKLTMPVETEDAPADTAPPVIPPQRYPHLAVHAPAVERRPEPAPAAVAPPVPTPPAQTPAEPEEQPPTAEAVVASIHEPELPAKPVNEVEMKPARPRRGKRWVRVRVMYRRTEGLRHWGWGIARRGLVMLMTGLFITAVWTPRLLWWAVSSAAVHGYRATHAAITFTWGVLSDAARATPRPERNPLMPRLSAGRGGPGDAASNTEAAEPRAWSQDVAPPYRPVVFMYPPKAQDTAQAERRPAAAGRTTRPTPAESVRQNDGPDATEEPAFPGGLFESLEAAPAGARHDREATPAARPRIVAAPSSLREPDLVDTPPPFQSTGWEIGILSAGLRNLVLAVVGATLGFIVGAVLFMTTPGPGVMAGVLLMIAGVGGLLLTLVQLNEWLTGLKHELTPSTRLGIRALGIAGAACLLAAFAVTTLPRGVWPI